jgi:hypothetical protein
VQGRRGVVLQHPDLRTDADAADEQLIRHDAPLQVHQELAALLVGVAQLLLVVDLRYADPAATVEGLHEQREADLPSDLAEVEELRVALERAFEVRLRVVALGRDEPGLRDGQAELGHRAVRGVLLHRLHGPRIVEDVATVEDGRLLDPFARRLVPVREPIDDQVVARLLAKVEGLDRDAFDVEADGVVADPHRGAEITDDVLEALRPAQVGPEG